MDYIIAMLCKRNGDVIHQQVRCIGSGYETNLDLDHSLLSRAVAMGEGEGSNDPLPLMNVTRDPLCSNNVYLQLHARL